MKGKRKKVQHFFVYIAMLVMSGFLIMGGLQQLSMTHELKSSIVQNRIWQIQIMLNILHVENT